MVSMDGLSMLVHSTFQQVPLSTAKWHVSLSQLTLVLVHPLKHGVGGSGRTLSNPLLDPELA